MQRTADRIPRRGQKLRGQRLDVPLDVMDLETKFLLREEEDNGRDVDLIAVSARAVRRCRAQEMDDEELRVVIGSGGRVARAECKEKRGSPGRWEK